MRAREAIGAWGAFPAAGFATDRVRTIATTFTKTRQSANPASHRVQYCCGSKVSLAYPLGAGPSAATTRAELIRSTFYRGASFTSGGVTVTISRTPEIAPGRVEEDRWVVPVRVRFHAHIEGN